MIALKRIRLVGWHYFDDVVIPIGEATLFAGDNGSGKSTVIDAIQYALAANLNRLRFNAAASDKRAGRTLEGYVRAKTGAESGEYLRDDAVAHVMLEFAAGGTVFGAGLCAEAFKDEVQVREYPWIADGVDIAALPVADEDGRPLLGRVFRDRLKASGAKTFESKREYNNELTHKLGVFRRNAEFNPYLDALLRSVSFTPLVSVDKFVCDYILDDRPVDVSAMKSNLQSYKEAEREAEDAIRKIDALRAMAKHAAEWAQFDKLIVFQEYLKKRADSEVAAARFGALERRIDELSRFLERTAEAIDRRDEERRRLESSRRDAEAALARDDAYLLVRSLEDKRDALARELARAKEKAERWETLRSQTAVLLERPLGGKKAEFDSDAEIQRVDEERRVNAARLESLSREMAETDEATGLAAGELADLEKGLDHFPPASERLKAALAERGINAWIFAGLLEVNDTLWQNAVEGWLNTLRFAVLVEPGRFRDALTVYDSLPREIAGISLPNLDRMRGARVQPNSLAELIETNSPYARIYVDFLLGGVIRADLDHLKDFEKAVTREGMSYSRYTANRQKPETYARWYLGRAAREKRVAELRLELETLHERKSSLSTERNTKLHREDALKRAYAALHEMRGLLEARQLAAELPAEIKALDDEIRAIDLSGVANLKARIAALAKSITEAETDLARDREEKGRAEGALEASRRSLTEADAGRKEAEAGLAAFVEGREALLPDCEAYYDERVKTAAPEHLADNYEASIKGSRTRLDRAADAYRKAVQDYNGRFNALLSFEPNQADEAAQILRRYVDSELPKYREKIVKARGDAERQFKDHFVTRLNEYIEEAKESFREINETLKALSFGRDQYRFTLEERADRRGQLEIIRKAADISVMEDGLFAQLIDPEERRAAEALFEKILRNELDSFEVRSLCDYRTYFSFDIKLRDLTAFDSRTGKAPELSLSKVIREKSGGEAQTPYYVAIAASFYRFYKDEPTKTIRLVLFDEAFNRMDDERIGKALEFFRRLKMQVITAVPTEKLETVAPYMDAIALVVRHGYHAVIRSFRTETAPHIDEPSILTTSAAARRAARQRIEASNELDPLAGLDIADPGTANGPAT